MVTAGLPPVVSEAPIVAAVLPVTVVVVIGNVAEVEPAATETDTGTETAALALKR